MEEKGAIESGNERQGGRKVERKGQRKGERKEEAEANCESPRGRREGTSSRKTRSQPVRLKGNEARDTEC